MEMVCPLTLLEYSLTRFLCVSVCVCVWLLTFYLKSFKTYSKVARIRGEHRTPTNPALLLQDLVVPFLVNSLIKKLKAPDEDLL